MSQRTFFPQRIGKLPLTLALAASSIVLTTGCANMATTAPAGNAFLELGTISGKIHGGNQPISGATINLYAAGKTGYGKGATLLATTTSANDGNGSFSFSQVSTQPGSLGSSYACPSPNSLLYFIASGGNTLNDGSSAYNSAAVMMAAVGKCSAAASTFTDINEITSVATITALQQYINPGTSTPGSAVVGTNGDYTLASPGTAGIGLINAFATAATLANFSTGVANAGSTTTGVNATVAGTVVTVTPEAPKINTIGNILAACVNNASATNSSCTTLFTNAVPPTPALTSQPSATFGTAVDTLQAAYYMATNPTDGGTAAVANLFALQTGIGAPFQTALSAAPTDWTIGVNYNAAVSGTATTCAGASTGKFIFYAYLVRADAAGNIWIASNGALPANLSQISPTGVPLACTLGATMNAIQGLTIDTSGYVWVAGHTAGGIQKVDPSTLTATAWTESGLTPWAIEADGSGNVFYTVASKPVHEFVGAATSTTAAASVAIGTSTSASQNYMTIDKAGSIWTTEQTATTGGLYQNYLDTSGSAVGGYSTAKVGAAGNVQAQIAVDSVGKIWTTQTTPANSITAFVPAVTPGSSATFTASATGAGGLSTPRGVAIDGAGNAWVPNASVIGVSVFDNNGNALSGSTGFNKPTTIFPSTLRSITIDPSGNLWMGTNATTVDSISEIVGAAVPVITPLSAALKAGAPATKP